MTKDIIPFSEAISIYRNLTGRRICRAYLEEQARRFRHLGLFGLTGRGSIPKLLGIRRHAWEYFIKTRVCLKGARYIFQDDEE